MNSLRRQILTAAALLCALLLSGCAERIVFSEKNVPVTAETVRLRLQSGETALLDRLTGLRRADFSGSLCYDELLAWAEAHPEVDTRYTVALPDGRLVDNSEEYLDLSGLDSALAGETAELLQYLPALKRVELGGGLSPAALGCFGLVRPDIRYSGSFTLGGEERRINETSLSLPGLRAAEIEQFRQLLPVMTALERVDLGSQELSPELHFDDIAAFQALRPETVFAFDFMLFGNAKTVLSGLLIANNWQWIGYWMLIYLAGLQSVPAELYEAARVDGAGPVKRFFHVTIPMLAPAITICVVGITTGSLKVYDLLISSTKGGPGRASTSMIYQTYTTAINGRQYGYGSAMTVTLVLMLLLVALIQVKGLKNKEVQA